MALLRSVFIVCAFATFCRAAMVIHNYDSDVHERFDTDRNGKEFIAKDLDLSGVARTSNGQWVTMVSPTHFLTSRHAPALAGPVTFHFDNDPTSANTMTCQIQSSVIPVNSTDVSIGQLNVSSCDATKLTYYELASHSSYINNDDAVYQVGNSSSNLGATPTTSMRVGRNRITDVVFGGAINSFGYWTIYADDSSNGDISPAGAMDPVETASLIEGETYFQGTDSGGPSFIVDGGETRLLGIHAFNNAQYDSQGKLIRVSDVNPVAQRRASGDVHLPSHAFDVRQGIIATAVPEPSPLLLLTLVGLTIPAGQFARHLLLSRRIMGFS